MKILVKKLDHLKNMTLENKLLSIIFANILGILLIAFMGFSIISNAYNRQLYKAVSGNLTISAYSIANHLKNIETMSSVIISSDIIQNSLSEINSTNDAIIRSKNNRQINQSLSNYYQSYRSDGAVGIALYNHHFVNWTNSVILNKTDTDFLDHILEETHLKEGAIVWTMDESRNMAILSRHVRKIDNLSLDSLGDLLIFVDLDPIVRKANAAVTTYGDSHYLIYNHDRPVYTTKAIDQDAADYFFIHVPEPYGVVSYNGSGYFAVKNEIPYYQWTYINLIPFDRITHSITVVCWLITTILLTGVTLTIFLSRWIMRHILRDFNLLSKKMEIFSSTELNLPPVETDYSQRKDEISQLHQHFDTMAKEIQNLVKTNYVNQILNRDAQLKALKAQINPHFLYNTLASVSWRAKALKDEQISAMVESLSTLLRATLNNNQSLVTLSQELMLANCYMTIQKIRFEERLNFCIQYDESLDQAFVPALTIQPLLENAVHYGMEEIAETCEIRVTVYTDSNSLIIRVSNEGSFFEEHLLEKLQDGSRQARGLGIGLLNINQRIQLLFGESFGLSFENTETTAVAIVTIPLKTGENTYAEDDYCR